MKKRAFLKLSTAGLAALSAPTLAFNTEVSAARKKYPAVDMDVSPISDQERLSRIRKAQSLMEKQDVNALVLEPGAAMEYFTGLQWWRSERLVCVVIPRSGEIATICPFFEEASIREYLSIGDDLRLWQEHESPFKRIKEVLADRGITSGVIGFENSVRYFVLDGIMSELSSMTHQSAEPITLACRMYKSANELKLMHKAAEITLRAYEQVFDALELGMSQAELKAMMISTQTALGGSRPWSMALFDHASAYPHGTKQQLSLKQGSLILMDSGCSVHGYRSDISRTLVYGEANKRQKEVWDVVRQGQQVAFDNAIVGFETGKIDDAVRKYYEKMGFGPDYKLPGLSHRTGHGIGMEIHESVNFVRNERTPLAKGMCLSNEPGIYIPGEFGVRVEDCVYMGDKRAHWFTDPPESIDKPLGKVAPLVL